MKLLSSDTIRRCFVADPGHAIITADFDQIELRVAAALAGEQSLIEAAKRGDSLHKIGAVKVFGPNYTPDQYRYMKNLNFGWLYGGGAKTLSEQTGVPIPECANLIRDYEAQFPALTAYKRREQELILRTALTSHEYAIFKSLRSRMYAFRNDTREGRSARLAIAGEIAYLCHRKIGYALTPFGRRIPVDANKAYTVVNYKVQSSAADILKQGLLNVMDDPELEPTVLLPVHDELLGQALSGEAEYIARRYGEVMTMEFLGVPITATGKVYGKSWGHGYRNQ